MSTLIFLSLSLCLAVRTLEHIENGLMDGAMGLTLSWNATMYVNIRYLNYLQFSKNHFHGDQFFTHPGTRKDLQHTQKKSYNVQVEIFKQRSGSVWMMSHKK